MTQPGTRPGGQSRAYRLNIHLYFTVGAHVGKEVGSVRNVTGCGACSVCVRNADMVVCFLIHTVCAVSALSPAESRILYSRSFGAEDAELSDSPEAEEPQHSRLSRKEKLGAVARLVRSAVCLSREASGSVCVETVLGEEAVALGEADCGVLTLSHGEPFAGPSIAIWLGVQALAFTMVCRPHENLLLAEGTLRNLARHCLEELRLLGPGSEVLLKSDRVDALLQRLLPHGQLLFLNHRFAQNMDKELSSYMSK